MIQKNDICGTKITPVNMLRAVDMFADNDWNTPGYICFSNAHTVAAAAINSCLRDAVNKAFLCFPSGAPVCALGNMLYGKNVYTRTFGADFMAECLKRSHELNLTHFFYGSTQQTLDRIFAKYAPVCGNRILGGISPPFGEISQSRLAQDFSRMRQTGAKIIWIGLGAPRQELFMHQNISRLTYGAMAGVGAAFEYEAETIKRAPLWMQNNGLQWICRLAQNPKRLWKRYLVYNTIFLIEGTRQLLLRRIFRKLCSMPRATLS
jgi:exopolysaccharide biosynthesis WecB/TagA/CpsF family protein